MVIGRHIHRKLKVLYKDSGFRVGVTNLVFEFEWGSYALSASEARTYNSGREHTIV